MTGSFTFMGKRNSLCAFAKNVIKQNKHATIDLMPAMIKNACKNYNEMEL